MGSAKKLICDIDSWDLDEYIESDDFADEFIKSDDFVARMGRLISEQKRI